MDTARIGDLLEPFLGGGELGENQLSLVSTYLDLLVKWNAKMNLTGVRDPEQIVQRHFGESFFAARHLNTRLPGATSLADLGSGAGFPGIPNKIWNPSLTLILVESKGKKAVFLQEVVRTLYLKDAQVVNARAEGLATKADIVTLRAVESFERALPAAARLLNDRGSLILLIGNAQIEKALAILPELAWGPPEPIPLSDNRVILTGTRKP